MLILLSVISLIVIIAGLIMYFKSDYRHEEAGTIIAGCGAIVFAIAIIAMICVGAVLATSHTIDEKITLYEQENRVIEEKINLTVTTYLAHEQETLTALTPENAANFVALIPELNSDSVVQQQIATYLENHETIVSLRVEKINLAKSRWWMYFGS